ncbi:MAG: proteasome subunit beta [Candidatus Diapherotrites archaeon]
MSEENMQKMKTGTTTVGVIGKECVVLAADQKATMGNIATDLAFTKIYKINQKIAVTIAGSVGDAQAIVRFLRAHAKLYEIERENPLTTKAAINLLSNVLNANRYYPYFAGFIVGGFNSKPELYSADAGGGFAPVEKFTTVGSGSDLALGYLDDQYKEGLPADKVVETAIRAIKVAKKRDVFTGGESITVFVISKDGIKELDKKEVEKFL